MTLIEQRNELGRYLGQWRTYSAIVTNVGDKFVCLNSVRILGQRIPLCKHVWVDRSDLRGIEIKKHMAIAFDGQVGMHFASGERHGLGARVTHGIEQVRNPFVLRAHALASYGLCTHVNGIEEIPLAPKFVSLIQREIGEANLRSVIVTAGEREYRLWLNKTP